MSILAWIGRGLQRVIALVGLIAWLGLTAAFTLMQINQVWETDGAIALAQRVAIGIGVPLLFIGSIVVLRVSGRWTDFFLTVVFGLVLCAVGSGSLTDISLEPMPTLIALGVIVGVVIVAALIPQRFVAWAAVPAALIMVAALFSSAPMFFAGQAPAQMAISQDAAASQLLALQREGRLTPGQMRQLAQLLASDGPGDAGPDVAPPPLTPAASGFQTERLRFNKPSHMRINRSYVVEAQIGMPRAQLLGDTGPTVSRAVQIPESRFVRVELIANDFDIVKLHTIDDVVVEPGTTGVWQWRVTPRTAGPEEPLILNVYGVVRADGREGHALLNVYRETIRVDVTPLDRAQIIARAFLARWDLVAGVAGAIGGLWLFFSNVAKFLRRRRAATPVAAS